MVDSPILLLFFQYYQKGMGFTIDTCRRNG